MSKVLVYGGLVSLVVGIVVSFFGVNIVLNQGGVGVIIGGMSLFVIGVACLFISYIRSRIEHNKLNSTD